ncbi:ribosomal large subunit pseudouridine synthase A [Fluviicoccus keumensis]|uniref:Pseudouridine synthase n=1 Tax=Fluviicoccus keumensis TaxID=1435465 RepID=A0A4V6MFY9_9GAMM|nr:RluA family pseudouridine synthase [Fluviicoccus keumensis]RZU45346.1 ribosomal large subunit pseudouridine synthase A [Fluviicoccus keumensis]
MLTDCPILLDDEHLLVIGKPEGLLSVPGKGPEKLDSLYWRLQQMWPGIRVVHRLDRDTSGLLVFARNLPTQQHLNRQFADRTVSKSYIALVYGHPAEMKGEVNLPIRYDPDHPPTHIVDFEHGKPSQTLWTVLERKPGHTRVLLEPVTGRSHQLRVHMQALGHPIVGDQLYATDFDLSTASRLCLHAETLEFTHPVSGERLRLTLPAPF